VTLSIISGLKSSLSIASFARSDLLYFGSCWERRKSICGVVDLGKRRLLLQCTYENWP